MSEIITIIFKIIKSKYFYIALIIIAILSYIYYLNINIKNKENKIKSLYKNIIELEATNTLLYKDLNFKSNQIYIKNSFTNSSVKIQNINNKELYDIEILNSIIADYYK